MYITAYHYSGVGSEEDEEIHQIFRAHDGSPAGSGYFFPTGERDIEYLVPGRHAKACVAALKAAGYKVDYPDNV